MKSLLLLVLTAATVFGECRTPVDQPCHTIGYTHSQWNLFHHGGVDLRYSTGRTMRALRSDGSVWQSNEGSGISLKHGPSAARQFTSLYLYPRGEFVRIAPAERTYSSQVPAVHHQRPFRRSAVGDHMCATGILHNGTDFRHSGTERLLGITAQRWWRSLGNGGSEEIWLAPDLDCIALRREAVYRNQLRLPTFIDSMEATFLRWGEPDPKLFTVPAGYRQVEPPPAPRIVVGR